LINLSVLEIDWCTAAVGSSAFQTCALRWRANDSKLGISFTIVPLGVFSIGHHRSAITRCCFDPGNQRVTSVSYDKTIKLWDMVARSTSITIKE